MSKLKKRFELELRTSSTGYILEVWDNDKNDYLPVIALGKLTHSKALQELSTMDSKYNI